MKKRLSIVCALLLAALGTHADNKVCSDNPALNGYVSTGMYVYLDNTLTDITGFQMDITLPDGVKPWTGGDSINMSAGYRITYGKYSLKGKNTGGNTYRVAFMSTDRTPVKFTSGHLFQFNITRTTAVAGKYNAGISNIVLACKDGSQHILRDTTFVVAVTDITKAELEKELQYVCCMVAEVEAYLQTIWSNVNNLFGENYFQMPVTGIYASQYESLLFQYNSLKKEMESIPVCFTSLQKSLQSAGTQEEFSGIYEQLTNVSYDCEGIKKGCAAIEQQFYYLMSDINTTDYKFPDQKKCWSITTPNAKSGLQMGYKSGMGFVLTSAGRIMFEQVKGNTFRLKDPQGHYVVMNKDKTLRAGGQSEATVWTGTYNNGTYTITCDIGALYCSGTSFNSMFQGEFCYGASSAYTISESTLTDSQVKDNLEAESNSPETSRTSWRICRNKNDGADFESIASALANGNVTGGDTLFVGAGTTETGTLRIKKSVVIIGPGYGIEDKSANACLYSVYVDAPGVELAGLDIRSSLFVNNNNISIRNCLLQEYVYGNKTSNENTCCTIHSCFITGTVYGCGENGADSWEISNNIITGGIRGLDDALINHNTFVTSKNVALNGVTSSDVVNNILYTSGQNPVQNCSNSYSYNITSSGTLSGTNRTNETLSKILSCKGSANDEDYYVPYAQGIAIKYSTDGSDCGAYGGKYPYIKGGKTGEFKWGDTQEEEVLSGYCGPDIKWHIDKATGTLYLEGSGRMTSYKSEKDVPWYKSAPLISRLSLDDNIVSIGSFAFSRLSNLTGAVTLPGMLKCIEYQAFNSTPITSVTFTQALDSIGYESFLGTGLTDAYLNMVSPPYGFGIGSVRGGSGKLTLHIPKGQTERYKTKLLPGDWANYYTIVESDYDCGCDWLYKQYQYADSLCNKTKSKVESVVGLAYSFAKNSIIENNLKKKMLADIAATDANIMSRFKEIKEINQETGNTFSSFYSDGWNNEMWNSSIVRNDCLKTIEQLTSNIIMLGSVLDEFIRSYGINGDYTGIGGTNGVNGNETGVCWSLDGSTGILSITGKGGMKAGLWSYWQSALIRHVILSDGISYIDKNAFEGSTMMDTMTCFATNVPKLENNVFNTTKYNTNGTLYVPASAIDRYKTASYWKDWANILPIETDPDNPIVTGFQVEPNDLLALKNLYQRYDGKNWSSPYQWKLDNNGRNPIDFYGVTFTGPDSLGYSYVKSIDLAKVGLKGDVTDWVLYFPELTSLNLSYNELEGDLTGFVSELDKLMYLNVKSNMLTGLTSLPASVSTLEKGRQFADMTDEQIALQKPLKVYISDRQRQSLPSIMTYNLATNSNKPSTLYISGRTRTMLNVYFGTLVPVSDTAFVYGTQWVGNHYVYSSKQDDEILLMTKDHSVYPAILVYEPGDANMSGYTDVLDIQTTITEILNPAKVPLFNRSAANTFDDDLINVQDVVCTVNIVLDNRNITSKQDSAQRVGAYSGHSSCDALYVTTATPLGAIDVELEGVSSSQVGLMLNRNDFQIVSRDTEKGSRHIIFSMSGKTVPVGTTKLFSISQSSVSVVWASMASAFAQKVDASIGFVPTDVQSVYSSELAQVSLLDGNLQISATRPIDNVDVSLMTTGGSNVYRQRLSTLESGTTVLPTTLSNGVYIVTISTNGNIIANVKLLSK